MHTISGDLAAADNGRMASKYGAETVVHSLEDLMDLHDRRRNPYEPERRHDECAHFSWADRASELAAKRLSTEREDGGAMQAQMLNMITENARLSSFTTKTADPDAT
eukprot:CAMPEP_0181247698 /NCGR_PEP_ID=MMETSP1096-20121128/44755_1 /TAXON_ID=156174 ORGANISM="Chrysochromulina ericina, Strain CCMP281" /NCGR_SAMPLE_ID=MMETSP1096 /ASSEMBLY_ACC=CAM_ASM_000453 /LENGTH=106 /DNA_ID=CAMNT_0023344777 /DNA_START=672 /DNA_END=994 /DNA_ORIENTATION=-